jgi:hypothetical protein
MGYYLPAGKYVYGDWKKLHEQGKVKNNYYPTLLNEKYQGMQKIKPVPEVVLDRDLNENYPDFWIDPKDLVSDADTVPTPPTTPTGTISDKIAGEAFVIVMKWIAQLF